MQQPSTHTQVKRAMPSDPAQLFRKVSPWPFRVAVLGQADSDVMMNARRVLATTARLWLANTDRN